MTTRSSSGQIEAPSAATVHRATLEVEVDGRTELVALALRDGEWIATSTGEGSEAHVRAALEALGVESAERSGTVTKTERPPASEPEGPFVAVAAALDDLATSVVRAGVAGARDSPGVREALATLKEVAPQHMGGPPLGLTRAVGRLRESILRHDVRECARVLDGCTRLASELREGATSPTNMRIMAWLGRSDGVLEGGARGSRENLSDRQLLEVARTWLSGFERRAIQRRFLLCLRSGTVYREDFRAGQIATAGPSPRILRVGLAESFPGPSPKRLRLLQYEVIPKVDNDALKTAASFARRDFSGLAEVYRSAVKAFPALAEPFVVVSADRYERGVAVDASQRRLPLRGEAGELERFDQLRARSGVRWLAGQLSDEDGIMVLAVHSACVETRDGLAFERLH